MRKPEKNFDTGLRILEVLNILLESDVSKNELIEKMNNNPMFENVYTFEAFIKYFNTLSLFGLQIEKSKNKYRLKNTFYRTELTKKEIDTVKDLIGYIKKLHNKKLENSIKNILYKSLKYMNEKTQAEIMEALEKSAEHITNVNNLTQTLETLLYDNRMIAITYIKNNNTQDTITVKIKEIIEKKGDIIIVCYDKKKARNKKINAASVISISQTPNIASSGTYSGDSVVFRIYGRLSEVYKLKDGETLVDFTAGYKTISCKGEDRDIIIKRLLKYGENCKIIQPQSLKDEFISMTDEIIKNLEEEIV